MIVYGINPVLEALRAGRVKALRIGRRDDDRMRELLAFASTHGITPERVTNDILTGRRTAVCIRVSSPTSTRRVTTASRTSFAARGPSR